MSYPDQSLNTKQVIVATQNPVDAQGNPATFDGPVQKMTSNSAVATFEPNGSILPVGVGTCTLTASAVSGGVPVMESFTVIVSKIPAVTFGFTFTVPALR